MKVAFLDRDGVINKFPGNGKYVTKVKDFHFLPGAREAIRDLTQAGYTLFVISNQAGVGKGVYSRDKLQRITRKMLTGVRRAGGKIKKVYYCTHRSDEGCDCRKPEIASIAKALKSLGKTLAFAKKSYFIGDTVTDMAAGRNAGCQTIFVLSGRSNVARLKKKRIKATHVARNLLAASEIILNGHRKTGRKKR